MPYKRNISALFCKYNIAEWWNGHSDHYLHQLIKAESAFGLRKDLL